MTQTETETEAPPVRTDVSGAPWTDYVRSVTFLDPDPDDGRGEPLHVGSRLLLDGEPTDVRVLLAGGFSITGGDMGTIVSFLVHPEDCHVGRIERDETGEVTFDLPSIGGRKVLTPFPDPTWSTEHLIDPLRTASAKSGYPANLQYEWMRVHIYVAEASCVRTPPESTPASA